MYTTHRLVYGALVASVVMCGDQSRAYADITGAIYDDAKGLIVELLTDEVAQAIVPNIACYAGRKPWQPAAGTMAAPVPSWIVDIDGEMFALDALYYYPQTLQRIYTRQFGALRAIAIHESAQLAGYQFYKVLWDISDSTIEKSGGERPSTPDKYYGWTDPGSQETCAKEVRKKFQNGVFAVESPGPLELACTSAGPSIASIRSRVAESPMRQQFTCELAFSLSSALGSDGAAADDHLLKAISAVVVEAINSAIQVPPASQTKLYERTILLTRDIVAKDSELEHLLKQYIEDAITIIDPAQDAAIRAAIGSIKSAIGRIRTQWRLATANGLSGVSLATFFETMATTAGSLADLCGDKPSAICQRLKRFRGSLERGQFLWPIVRAAAQRNSSEAANVAIRAIFAAAEATRCSTETDPDASCARDAFRGFFISFAQYVIESSSEGTPTEVTRAALRTAAVQAIRSLGVGGGFDRRGWLQWHRIPYWPGKAFFYPEFGLRASWNPAYLNRTDTNLVQREHVCGCPHLVPGPVVAALGVGSAQDRRRDLRGR
jgi:hypothetical protein